MVNPFKKLLQEPLFQFVILGALLFFVTGYIREHNDRLSREIIVDNAQVNLMVVKYQSQNGSLPSKQQLDAMIENYIREEISFREAKKIGLEKEDEIIRRRLVQKYDFLKADLTNLPNPTEAELQQFYSSHPELFQQGATVSFTHIYFNADNGADSAAIKKAGKVLVELSSGKLQRAPEKGDRFPLQYDYTDQGVQDIRQNFGDKPFADELFSAPLKTWNGPVKSGYGWHLLYISKRDTANTLPYVMIRDDVRTKFLDAEKANHNKKAFDLVQEKYLIHRSYLDSK